MKGFGYIVREMRSLITLLFLLIGMFLISISAVGARTPYQEELYRYKFQLRERLNTLRTLKNRARDLEEENLYQNLYSQKEDLLLEYYAIQEEIILDSMEDDF